MKRRFEVSHPAQTVYRVLGPAHPDAVRRAREALEKARRERLTRAADALEAAL